MAIPEGRVFEFQNEDSIKPEFLEVIEFLNKNRQNIVYETDEFAAVCPFSGLPDLGRLEINYIPDKHIVELKSLKYYLISYRDVGIYQEAATDRIYNDLYNTLNPKYLEVITSYNTRGGIDTTCSISSEDQ